MSKKPDRRSYIEGEEYICVCGCGKHIKVAKHHKFVGIPNYIHGHSVPWNKGLTKETSETLAEMGKKVSKANTGKVSSFKGMTSRYTKEVTEQISVSLKGYFKENEVSEETRKKISKGVLEATDRIHNEEVWNKIAKSNTGKSISKESIKKAKITRDNWSIEKRIEVFENKSKARMRVIEKNNGVNPGGYKNIKRGTYFSIKNNCNIKYDSGLELEIYKVLEQMSLIKCYERCDFYIRYNFDGATRRYYPDIKITYQNNEQEVIEVKPAYLIEEATNQAKFIAAKKYCKQNNLKFSVWTESAVKGV